ncbi:hypothetical protein EV714DRAFT_271574 [Schizophyllum commune]
MTTFAAAPRLVLISATEDRDLESQQYQVPSPRRERKGTLLPPYSPRGTHPGPASRKGSEAFDGFKVIDLADCTSSAPHPNAAPVVVACTYPPNDLEASMQSAYPPAPSYSASAYPDEKHPQSRQQQYIIPSRSPWIMHVVSQRQGTVRRGLLVGSWVACLFLMGLAAVLVFAQAKLK